MANIITADEILAGGGGLYLNSEDKASLHTEQRAFYITSAVAEQEGQYGVQTVFTIKEKGKDSMQLKLINEEIDESNTQMREFKTQLDNSNTKIISLQKRRD
jgi:hypothetical protein